MFYTTVLERLLQEIKRPMPVEGGHSVVVQASIGGSFYPQHGNQVETLITLADTAMYEAKSCGKDRFVLAEQPG